ncbi:aminopyrimidine aminohydrolase [Paenibacillus glycanilyticus]|uniref:Aminopyrimidine aminohydrolase n=1 Tax=Paenibacillus glycanilyticus TaxID=126569 RepID=A0ABQ6NWQ9_9BACL|nr:thiaminase II [Paenibacillus glycanilyticus]GMK48964.1 aminopyrimidine aminohydrolase [Paenibacillus glycanilyticus]
MQTETIITGKFTGRLYESSKGIWERSHRHPFLEELKAGTLDPAKFIYYLKQDYVYLIDYAKMFAYGSIKANDLLTMGKFSELCHSILNVEMGLHRQYAERFGVTREELESTEPSPTTIAYTKYLLDVAAHGSLAEVAAAVLPCMWSYREIGVLFAEAPGALDHPLYRDWILMYSSEEFGELTSWCIGIMDELAEGLPEPELAKLEQHFIMASKLEYMFWDMAYREEEWPA